MAAKINWHRYGTKLCHCHSMYKATYKIFRMHMYLAPHWGWSIMISSGASLTENWSKRLTVHSADLTMLIKRENTATGEMTTACTPHFATIYLSQCTQHSAKKTDRSRQKKKIYTMSVRMWSLRWHFTNKSVTGAPYSIESYSLSHSWTLWWRVRLVLNGKTTTH